MQTMSMSASGGKADIPDTRPSAASLTFRTSAVTRSLKLFCGRLAGAQVTARHDPRIDCHPRYPPCDPPKARHASESGDVDSACGISRRRRVVYRREQGCPSHDLASLPVSRAGTVYRLGIRVRERLSRHRQRRRHRDLYELPAPVLSLNRFCLRGASAACDFWCASLRSTRSRMETRRHRPGFAPSSF